MIRTKYCAFFLKGSQTYERIQIKKKKYIANVWYPSPENVSQEKYCTDYKSTRFHLPPKNDGR